MRSDFIKSLIPILVSLTLLASFSSAQTPSNEWDIGWESDDEPEIMTLDSVYNFDITIQFWIENSRPVEASIEFEVETNDDFNVDDPGSVSVPANSNETFEITISAVYLLSSSVSTP